MKNPMKNPKAIYSSMMIGYEEDEKEMYWSETGYIYKKVYVDPNDEKAFNTEEEVDEFRKQLNAYFDEM